MNCKLLAERLKSARHAMNLTQRQLAEKCHMLQQTVANYECAKIKRLSRSALKRFAEALEVDADWLADGALKRRTLFAERLRSTRNALGFSRAKLAGMVYMSADGILHYERRGCYPPPETLKRLAEALNVGESWLTGND